MDVIKNLVSSAKYDIKCPYIMNPEYITVHNTANDASAANEINYMINNNNQVSFHYAVDDSQIVQGIPENRNAWHAGDGNGKGNRASIAVEICYSKSGGELFDKAKDLAAQFVAEKLKEKGWGLDRVRTHQSWSGKYCPHRLLDEGWSSYLNLIGYYLGKGPKPELTQISINYQANIGGKNQMLPIVRDRQDDAGLTGRTIEAIWARPTQGQISYRVHLLSGIWLPFVTTDSSASGSHNTDDYAGIIGREIDGIQFKGNIKYRAKLYGGNWLPEVTGESDFAGILGRRISNFQCYV